MKNKIITITTTTVPDEELEKLHREIEQLHSTIKELEEKYDNAKKEIANNLEILKDPVAVRLNIRRGMIVLPDDYVDKTAFEEELDRLKNIESSVLIGDFCPNCGERIAKPK